MHFDVESAYDKKEGLWNLSLPSGSRVQLAEIYVQFLEEFSLSLSSGQSILPEGSSNFCGETH